MSGEFDARRTEGRGSVSVCRRTGVPAYGPCRNRRNLQMSLDAAQRSIDFQPRKLSGPVCVGWTLPRAGTRPAA
jgi:hypothetical protein